MRTQLLSTTAAIAFGVVLLGSPLVADAADSNANAGDNNATVTYAATIDAESLIGKDIENADGDTIGEIESVIIDRDGNVRYVIVGVGGFLGIGERNVALTLDSLDIDDNGEVVTTRISKAQIEALPEHRYPDTVKPGIYAYDDDIRVNTYLADGDRTAGGANTVDADTLIGRDIENAEGETIGDVESVVIDKDGKVRHVIVGVGGFLGIGERNVALAWDSLTIEENGERVMANLTKAQLEALPAHRYPENVQRGVYGYDDDLRTNPYLGDSQVTGGVRGDSRDRADEANRADARDADDSRPTTTRPGALHASELVGVDIKNGAGDTVGEIGEILLDRDGEVQGVIVDVGGFLGMGEHPVIVDWNEVEISRDKDDEVVATVSMSKDQLNALPEYKKAEMSY